jgi:hypothetical protein
VRITATATVVLSLSIGAGAAAQNEPATIPTVVAQASGFTNFMVGRTEYFNAQAPTDWPASLVPPGARIIGGAALGDGIPFRMLTLVVDLSSAADPRAAVAEFVKHAGFVRPVLPPSQQAGFVPTRDLGTTTGDCKGDSLLTFNPWDAAHMPGVVVMQLITGPSGNQSCNPRNQSNAFRSDPFPVTLPPLTPPAGVYALGGGGTSWSDGGGEASTQFRTTLSVDSVLDNYSAQLVAAKWVKEGKPAIGSGVAAQRFTVHQGEDDWNAELIVFATTETRDVLIRLSKLPRK